MNELIQTTTGLIEVFYRSICWDFEVGSRSMEMAKVAIIFDESMLSLLSGLTMAVQIH